MPQADTRKPAGFVPSAFALLVATLWGANNVSLKAALEYAAPLQVGWMRFVLGGAVTAFYMIARRESFRVPRNEVKPVLIIGGLFAIQLIIMNVGQDLTSAGHGTALSATMPIWTATIAQILIPSDRLTRWRVLAMALSYLGVLAVVFGPDTWGAAASESGVTLMGDVLSLVSAILLALRIVLTSNYAQNVSEAKLMMGQLVIGTILLLPGSYLFESPVSYTLEGRFWFALGYQGLVIAGFGFLASAWLVKRYLPSSIAFFYFVQPVAGVVLAWWLLGEDPGQGLLLGIALICAGALTYSAEALMKARRAAGA